MMCLILIHLLFQVHSIFVLIPTIEHPPPSRREYCYGYQDYVGVFPLFPSSLKLIQTSEIHSRIYMLM